MEHAEASPTQISLDLNISGMTCAGCSTGLEKALRTTSGITEASVNLLMETAHVQYESHLLSEYDVLER